MWCFVRIGKLRLVFMVAPKETTAVSSSSEIVNRTHRISPCLDERRPCFAKKSSACRVVILPMTPTTHRQAECTCRIYAAKTLCHLPCARYETYEIHGSLPDAARLRTSK